MTRTFHTSRPDRSVVPRPHTDPHQRFRDYGPIRAMDYDPDKAFRARAWRIIIPALALFWLTLAIFIWS